MSLNIERKSLNLNQCVVNKNMSAWVEQDIIVPDSMPDAVKIVTVMATPYISNVENMETKMKVSGKINYFIIYNVNDEKFISRGLYVSYPYTEILDVDDVEKDAMVTIIPICKNVIYSLPNERKISTKCEILFKIAAKKQVITDVINKFADEDMIECKMCKGKFNNIKQCKKSIIAAKEDVILPKDSNQMFEILKADPKIKNTEYKESYNKIMVKGDIEVILLYLSDSSDNQINKVSITVPFSSMIELDNIRDNSKFDISYILQDFDIKVNPDIDSRTVSANYQIEANVTMFEDEEIEYVEDFYSQTRELKYDENRVQVVKKDINVLKRLDIRENINNIIPEDMRLIDYNIDTSYITTETVGSTVSVDGTIKLNLLLQDQNTFELESKSVDVIVNEKFELENVGETQNVYVSIIDKSGTVTQSGNDIEMRVILDVGAFIEDVANMSIIDKIEESELDLSSINSINIYIVKPGDTLWNIAKKYKTSVEKIVMTNNIENPDVIDVGDKLLIIR
ncbi:MAG: DUF3794 domain-containing protein [Clostridia bacterium]|nr:DUF3794 domain-containing protein [Clostridia bacterium]